MTFWLDFLVAMSARNNAEETIIRVDTKFKPWFYYEILSFWEFGHDEFDKRNSAILT